jgi:RimJ/RimL family protein N-acetyltransferase
MDFASSRLLMRPLSGADAGIFQELFTDARTMEFIGPPLSPQRAARSFKKYVDSSAARQLFFVIIEPLLGQAIGLCALQELDERRRSVEVGIMLKPAFHARGFATEGLAALVGHAFGLLPVDEVRAQVAAINTVVERLVLSVGFVRRSGADNEHPAKYSWSIDRNRRDPKQ